MMVSVESASQVESLLVILVTWRWADVVFKHILPSEFIIFRLILILVFFVYLPSVFIYSLEIRGLWDSIKTR